MSFTTGTTPRLIAAVVGVLVAGALGGCSFDRDGSPDEAASTSGTAAGSPDVGDCLAGGSPKGPHEQYYLLSDLIAVPCSRPHTLEIYAPEYSVGGVVSQVDAGDRCPSPSSYLGWTQRPVWVSRLAVVTVVSSLKSGAKVRVFCSSAVVEPFGVGGIRAVPTTGAVRGAASQPDAVARFGACMAGVPAVSQGVLSVPCLSGRDLWLKGVVTVNTAAQKYPGPERLWKLTKRPCLQHVRQLTGSADTPNFSLQLPGARAWASGWREAGCHVRYDAVRRPATA